MALFGGSQPTNLVSAFGADNIDYDRMKALQTQTEQDGRRISLDEWQGIGGTPDTYQNLYAGTVDQNLVNQFQAESPVGQASPWQYLQAGGDWRNYHNLYNTIPLSAQPTATGPGSWQPTANPFGDPSQNANTALTAQLASNLQNIDQQQTYNRPDQVDPFGSARWQQNPDGTWSHNVSLSGSQGAINDLRETQDIGLGSQALSSLGQVGNAFGSPLDMSQLPQAPWEQGFERRAQGVSDSIYNQFSRRNEPRFQQEMEQFEQNMADRGIPQGSEQYNRAKLELNQRHEDARLNAQDRAFQAAGDEQSRLYGLAERGRESAFGEARDLRNMPAQELAALNALTRGVQRPTYSQPGQLNIPGLDAAGIGGGFANLANQIALQELANQGALDVEQLRGENKDPFESQFDILAFRDQLNDDNRAYDEWNANAQALAANGLSEQEIINTLGPRPAGRFWR